MRFTEYGRRRPIVALQESRKAASRADKQKCLRFGPNFCLELFGGVERRVYSAVVGGGGRAELEHRALHWVLVVPAEQEQFDRPVSYCPAPHPLYLWYEQPL